MRINFGNVKIKKKINFGNVKLGVKKVYPELENLEITPRDFEQKFNHPDSYGYNEITVNPVVIKLQNKEVNPSTTEQIVIADEEYYGLKQVNVKAIEGEEISIIPSSEEQTKQGLYKKVTVIGDSNLVPENIAENKEIFGVKGTMIAGWDTSQIRECYQMFYKNTEMIEAPYFDTSNVTNMKYMFSGCKNLTTVPQFNTSNVTNMQSMFSGCTKLTTVPQFNTSNVTNMSEMFIRCKNLTTVPQFNTSNVTNMYSMFSYCTNLTTVPQFNTSNVTDMYYVFNGCTNLTTVPQFDTSNATDMYNMFEDCTNLTDFGGVKDLGKAYTIKTSNHYDYKFNLSYCEKLTHESLISVINSLYDLNLTYDVANGGILYSQQLVLGSTNLAKLTAEEILIATNKGWTVS